MTQKQNQKYTDYISLSEAAKIAGYTPEYLNLLSRKGKIQAEKIGRNWYTKKEWVEIYLSANSGEKNGEKFLTLSEAAKLIGYTPEHLNLRVRQGKLKAEKIGRNWHTKKEWLDEFLAGGAKETEDFHIADESKQDQVEEEKNSFFSNGASDAIKKLGDVREFGQTKNEWMKIFAAVSSVVIIAPIIFAGSFIVRNFLQNYKVSSERFANYESQNKIYPDEIINENTGTVAAAEDTATKNGLILASENFRAADINVGGDVLVLAEEAAGPLAISNIKSEPFLVGKQNQGEAKLAVSWLTNVPSISTLEYSMSGGQNSDSVREDSYGFSHSAVIDGLKSGSSYVFKIKARDKWGNEIDSDYYGVYAPAKPLSIFDLIAQAVGETFSWAIKK